MFELFELETSNLICALGNNCGELAIVVKMRTLLYF